ncbi:MAG: YidC/Oxa1 family membrane protein insertase [Lachnospiraceae bacterium]|nr:YidC/Oxa1 family membrane protein insertase [Lachnospiraceae bacterium]
MLLTQSTTPIIGWIATLLGYVMELIYTVLDSVGIQNVGLCIIIFTIFVRLLMLPMTFKQQQFTKINQIMQPEIAKIQKKYRNKKDQASMVKQNEEIQAVYEKYGVSPTGGCLQLIIQFPVLLALYQVIRKIPAYIPQVKATYMTAVTAISGQAGYIDKINKISEGLKSSYVTELAKDASPDQVIDVLNYFTADTWDKLAAACPSVSSVIENVSHEITSINDFVFGINVAQTPGLHISVYLIIPILAALFQFLSAKTMQQPQIDGNDQMASMNKSMTYMMPLMSLYFCIIMPAGLGIYWVTSALFQCIQQVAINTYMNHADLEKMVAKNRAKAEKKKAKGKKSIMERLTQTSAKAEAAKEEYEHRSNTMREISTMNLKKINSKAEDQYENIDTSTLGEIGKKAYLVSQYEKEHNTRGGKK